jgi:hypothetical protein
MDERPDAATTSACASAPTTSRSLVGVPEVPFAEMSRTLRASGYVALTVQMAWGLIQTFAISPAGPGVPPVAVGAHAHFGVLSILAVVTGFAIERTALTGTLRAVAIWGFVVGQWLLPATILMEMVAPPLLLTAYLWGAALTISMAIVAWGTITAGDGMGQTPGGTPAD